jgi:hypothetical protein
MLQWSFGVTDNPWTMSDYQEISEQHGFFTRSLNTLSWEVRRFSEGIFSFFGDSEYSHP